MAETYTLEAQPRTITGKKVSQLRNQGLVPAVIYGGKVQPVHLQIPYRALELALRKAGGTHLITITYDGAQQTVLAREVQRNILKGTINHVDFMAVDMAVKLRAEVRVHFVNEAPAVQRGLGVLLNGVQTLEIEALPSDLVDRIDVDLSSLQEVNDAIFVRDIKANDKVTIVTDGDEMVVRVIVQQVVEEAPLGEITASEPEVIKKGKEDDEDDG
ncbi:MAG: 50S ribosomal protein L25 [bacterium]|nr:50S ribosomal protein L25 [bacterium]